LKRSHAESDLALPDAMADLPPPEPEPERSDLYRPVGVRSASLAVLALVACVYALHWAAAVFIPLLLAMMFSYALSPVVDRLARHHVPRWLGAAAVILAVLGGFGTTIHALGDDATALVESLPDAAQKLGDSLRKIRGAPRGTMEKVQNAATRLEQAAEESGATAPRAGKGLASTSRTTSGAARSASSASSHRRWPCASSPTS
jgi:predicted PurR-regulated permease PerM